MTSVSETMTALALVPTTLERPSPALTGAVALLPKNPRWDRGRADLPWGLGNNFRGTGRRPAVDIDTVCMGRSSWFFRTDTGNSYDTLREAFVGERLNCGGETCGCVRMPGSRYAMATVDCGAQLELMREVLRRVLMEMPNLDLASLADDLFEGSMRFMEHYIWWLERELFVGHVSGEERQDRLSVTDEGFAVLSMLELTRPGSNHDLSPEAVHRLRIERGPLPEPDERPYRGRGV